MNKIRPKHLFQLPDGYSDQISYLMPEPDGQGTLTTLEHMVLLKLMRLSKPQSIFEFGTFKGRTTRILVDNIPHSDGLGNKRVLTLDLPDTTGVEFTGDDLQLAKTALNYSRKYLESKNAHLVQQLLLDSMLLSTHDLLGQFQFIFIDANHKAEYVRSDTEKAFEMLAADRGIVAWHDYGNPQFPELTEFLNNLSRECTMYHVEDTMLSFYARDLKIETN